METLINGTTVGYHRGLHGARWRGMPDTHDTGPNSRIAGASLNHSVSWSSRFGRGWDRTAAAFEKSEDSTEDSTETLFRL